MMAGSGFEYSVSHIDFVFNLPDMVEYDLELPATGAECQQCPAKNERLQMPRLLPCSQYLRNLTIRAKPTATATSPVAAKAQSGG